MKRRIISLLLLTVTIGTFAQKADFINAPLNPYPYRGNASQQNLKGDVFQLGFLNYGKDGKWFSYHNIGGRDKVELNAAGQIIKEGQDGTFVSHKYDTKGNVIETTTGFENKTFSYDKKNRLVKEVVISKKNETSSSEFSYKQENDLLIVNQLYTGSNQQKITAEIHFKNGLQVYIKTNGYAAVLTKYQFDRKNNWIRKIEIDATTNKETVTGRQLTYYDEFDKGAAAFTVIAERLRANEPMLVPRIYINKKKLYVPFCRFVDDYIFYDVLSKTYYIARGAYSKSNAVGNIIPVGELITGYEPILLFNGEKLIAVNESGDVERKGKYTYTHYDQNYIAKDTVGGTATVFGKLPQLTSLKTVALGGTSMLDAASCVWYIHDSANQTILLFDHAKLTKSTGAGYTGTNNDMVMALDNKPKYVLTNFKTVADKVITQGRYFDPARDKLKTTKR